MFNSDQDNNVHSHNLVMTVTPSIELLQVISAFHATMQWLLSCQNFSTELVTAYQGDNVEEINSNYKNAVKVNCNEWNLGEVNNNDDNIEEVNSNERNIVKVNGNDENTGKVNNDDKDI